MKKFFDSVDQEILLKILSFRIKDSTTLNLLKEIISSFNILGFNTFGAPRNFSPESRIGMPIGNLTSQIFANIYLNKLDRFVKHELGAKAYLRYGDDFIIVENDLEKLQFSRTQTRLNSSNLSNYSGLVKTHCNNKKQKHFSWLLLDKLID